MLKDKPDGNAPAGEYQPKPQLPALAGQPPARSKSGLLVVIVLIAIVAIGSIVGFSLISKAAAAKKTAAARNNVPPVPIIVGTAKLKNVPIYLDGLGTVQAFNTVTVRVRVDGQLKKVAFAEGQDVHAGDLLVQIDPDPLNTQLQQSIAKKAQDAALLANSQIDLKRETELLAAKIDSQQVYDTQKALVDQYVATVNADQAAIDSAQVQLNYTTVTSPIDGRTGIRLVDQGNIVHATDTNGVVVITQLKPISVVFTLPEQVLGELRKHSSSEAFKVVAVDRDNSTPLDEGVLAVIDNQIDTTTGTLKLKATFPNENLRLWPGQFVNARLLLTTHTNGVTVPAVVIQRGPQGDYVFVVDKSAGTNSTAHTNQMAGAGSSNSGGKTGKGASGGNRASQGGNGTNAPQEIATAKMRPVTDQLIDGVALIEKGLSAGERVVVEGQYKLQDGSPVRITSKSGSTDATNAAPDSVP